MGKYSFLTKELLQEYYDELGSQAAIAEKCNIPLHRVKYYTRKLGVKMDPSGGKTKYIINEDIFSKDSEIGFYIAGFIAADGGVTHDSRSNTSSLNIGLAREDKSHLLKIKGAMSFSGPILDYSSYDKRHAIVYHLSKLQIYCSKKIIKDLEINFNIVPQKSLIYQFPTKIINYDLVRHFIRGYFDGDGCFSTDKRTGAIGFELLGTKEFLENVKSILERECDLYASLSVLPMKNIYRLRFYAETSMTSVAKFLYGDATLYLQRKFDMIKHML